MSTIPDDLGMDEVRHTWWEPAPGTTAWRLRAGIRWSLALTFGLACVVSLIFIDFVSPVGP